MWVFSVFIKMIFLAFQRAKQTLYKSSKRHHRIHSTFHFFLIWVPPSSLQDLLLCSGITPGKAQRTIWDAQSKFGLTALKAVKALSTFLLGCHSVYTLKLVKGVFLTGTTLNSTGMHVKPRLTTQCAAASPAWSPLLLVTPYSEEKLLRELKELLLFLLMESITLEQNIN